MSLVSNNIGAIASKIGQSDPSQQSLDLGDKTFSVLLDKQMNIQDMPEDMLSTFGAIASVGADSTNLIDLISSINQTKKYEPTGIDDQDDLGSSEMVAFLTKPFDSQSSMEHNRSLMDFAKKQASNFYNKCASNVVVDLKEFIEDTLKHS